MTHLATSIDIAAPVQDVWDLATDLNRMAEWVSIHREFPTPPPGRVEAGTQFTQTLAVAGTPFDVAWTAAEVDSPSKLAWNGIGPAGTTAHTTYTLAEHGGGTRFTYENDFHLPGGEAGAAAGHVVAGKAEREAEESLTRLKALAEA